jgi:hypothetical protein
MLTLPVASSLLLCLVLLLKLSLSQSRVSPVMFSGFYLPDLKTNFEPFASAWLISKEKFIDSSAAFDHISNFEGTVFAVLSGMKAKKKAIMTRDYFDFQVEHMSSTLNLLAGSELHGILRTRLEKRVDVLRNSANRSSSHLHAEQRPPKGLTVAILPFSSHGAHNDEMENEDSTMKLRILMFQATFWSLKKHNFEVVVSVSSQQEFDVLSTLNLPIFQIYTFYNMIRKSQQPKKSLQQAVIDIQNDVSWQQFAFVYYSDADQILHMRNWRVIYDTLLLRDKFTLCPHRLQTMVLPSDVPKAFRNPSFHLIESLSMHTKHANIIHESHEHTKGSCCDDGRYRITNSSVCNNFWYHCELLHPYTLMEWIKFGPHGFTAPLTTEHMGRCRYFPHRRQCDVPKDCEQPSPLLAGDKSVICNEISKIHVF